MKKFIAPVFLTAFAFGGGWIAGFYIDGASRDEIALKRANDWRHAAYVCAKSTCDGCRERGATCR